MTAVHPTDLPVPASSAPRGFMAALKVQARVIIALALRDIVAELGTSRAAPFWMIFRPALLVTILYFTYSAAHRLMPSDMPLLIFLVTSWLGWFMFIRVFKDSSTNNRLLMFPQVTPLDLMLANFVTEWLIYTFVFLLFVLAALMIERSPLPANGLQVILAYWSIALMAFLASLSFFSLARIVPAMNNLTLVIRRLGHMVGGVIVTGADTPYAALKVLKWNPLFHCFELMREAWWPAYVSPIADPGYVAQCIFYMAAIGLIIERATRRWIS